MRYVLLGIMGLFLSACALPVPIQIASWAASGISYLATGKSVSDHALSAVASEDCAVHRVVLGEHICHPFGIAPDGTAVASKPATAKTPVSPENPSQRLRDSMVILAANIDDRSSDNSLQPASGPDDSALPGPAAASKTPDQMDDALLAMADAINHIKPAATAVPSTRQAMAGQHYLIIGRYRNLNEAEDVRGRHASLHTAVRMILRNGALLFQVTAGPFKRPDALDIGNTLAAKGTRGAAPEIALLCADRVTPAPCGAAQDTAAVQVSARPDASLPQ